MVIHTYRILFHKNTDHTQKTILERQYRYAETRKTGDLQKCTHDWQLAHTFSSGTRRRNKCRTCDGNHSLI